MDKETIECVLDYLRTEVVKTLDITGGAPELHADFRYLVIEARKLNLHVIDRCNLTILLEPGQEDLGEFLATHQVEIIASMPCYLEENVDRQRGKGVFEKSIQALQRLNILGYGRTGSDLMLNLIYNPQGPSLPPAQDALERDYKKELGDRYGIEFNKLFTLSNMPINRFGGTLISTGQFDDYIHLLKEAHRDENLENVMCRNLVSVDWQGYVYDCDFNQMLGLHMRHNGKSKVHLSELINVDIEGMPIVVRNHCYGCTAGQGSSCGGALTS